MVAIPIPIPPLPIPGLGHRPAPLQIPTPGNPIPIFGHKVAATWNDVWGFVKGSSKAAVGITEGTIDLVVNKVLPIVEAYVGQSLKAVSSYINNLGDFASELTDDFADFAATSAIGAVSILDYAAHVAGALYTVTDAIVNHMIPGVGALAEGAYDYAWNIAHELAFDVMNWTLQSVMNPVLAELAAVEIGIRDDVFTLVDAVAGTLSDMITEVDADLLARLGLVAAVAAAALTFVEECGNDLCSTMGPKTDLFKFLKAFEAAGILALLMEIGNMTEADVEARLRDIAGDVGNIVSTFEDVFVGGGGSLLDFGKALV